MTTNMPSSPSWLIGAPQRAGAVTVLPVFAATALPARAYRLGIDALADRSLEVHEGEGHVLEARNRGARVLLVEGDHLLGAHQNRMLTSSALIGARATLGLPVSCVERGRSSGPSSRFDGAGPMASAALRRIAKRTVTESLLVGGDRHADQGRIWDHIASQQSKLRVRSATSSLAHTYAARADDIGSTASALPYAPKAIGLAIAISGELVSADVFGDAATCAAYWPRLVAGAALDGLRARRGPPVHPGQLHALLEELQMASWLPVAAVGEGTELRAIGARAMASALYLDGQLVHFGLATGPALSSSRDTVWNELPEQLAARYRIVRRLGVGGAKEVFRAVDVQSGEDVAIARLPWVREDMFQREIALVQGVRSRYVPRIIASYVDEDRGDGYIVMEHCEGSNLAQLGPLPVAEAGPILLALARALRDIHEAKVLHRDVKLENVMIAPDGDVKVLDFGVSAWADTPSTAVGRLSTEGTLPHMAREVIMGHALDARADVFAFGVSCYRLLVGMVPLPPERGESEFSYLDRLRQVERYDLEHLPELPADVRDLVERMLAVDREKRPFMPEVAATLDRAFGSLPRAQPQRPRPRLAFERARDIAVPLATPEHLLVAACLHAPLIALVPERGGTTVRAFAADGTERWTHELDANLTAGIRADLDGDGVREVYLAGPRHLVALAAATGKPMFRTRVETEDVPQLLAIVEGRRLVLDGHIIDPRDGRDTGLLGNAFSGDGTTLVRTEDMRGLAFNGFAQQAFRGAHATAAAIVCHPEQPRFHVAHLEEIPERRGVHLVIYGPGGARTHALHVADCAVPTGDRREISRVFFPPVPALFGPGHAPLAMLHSQLRSVVIVPLLAADPSLPSQLVAFELPVGRERWRHAISNGNRAILAGTLVVVGTGEQLIAHDAWTGEPADPLASRGAPVAFGDPFASGRSHLVAAAPDGIELWRGAACRPNVMTWSGPRGDLWRSGAVGVDGSPFGPL